MFIFKLHKTFAILLSLRIFLATPPHFQFQLVRQSFQKAAGEMVLRKSCRVWRKHRPRSVILESRDVPDHCLLFESDVIATLSKWSCVLEQLASYMKACRPKRFSLRLGD